MAHVCDVAVEEALQLGDVHQYRVLSALAELLGDRVADGDELQLGRAQRTGCAFVHHSLVQSKSPVG